MSILTALVAFAATALLVWMLIPVARQIGLVDRPGGRKTHDGDIPTVGGLAIAMGVIVSALGMGFSDHVHPAFWAGFIVIVLVGTLDDLRDLGHHSKFLAQIAAAGLMLFWAGWHLDSLGRLLGDWPLTLGRFAIPLTFIAVIGVMNAVNFTDGADGLCGGLVLNALFWFCVMEFSRGAGGAEEAQLTVAFFGAVAAFLVFNLRAFGRRHARIFLGDAGSLGLGFVLAWLMVSGAERSTPLFAPVTAIWLMAVPLVDTLTCSGRRLLAGTSPFKADRKHLHHILLGLGLPVAHAVGVIHAAAFVLAAAGVAGWYFGVAEYLMFYAAMAIFVAYLIAQAAALRVIEEGRHRKSGLQQEQT